MKHFFTKKLAPVFIPLTFGVSSFLFTPPLLSQTPPQQQNRVNRPVLSIGSKGESVQELQAMLRLLGYYTGEVNGIYSESTVIAVAKFQEAAGLEADGITGTATWDRLFPAVAALPPSGTQPPANNPRPNPTTPNLPVLRLGMRGNGVRQLQERLRALGFLKNRPDSVFGEETLRAVQAAQRHFNLQPDGVVGPSTWRVLQRQN